MNNMEYGGYKNNFTWITAIWLGSEEGSYRYWREAASEERRKAPNCPQVREQLWTEENAARFLLADRLEKEVCNGARTEPPGLYSDLLRLALSDVDWHEVADGFLEE